MGGETADDPDERAALVRSFADEIGHTPLVKGAVDVVSDGDGGPAEPHGEPGMTVGGTGDVLAGAVGARCGRDRHRGPPRPRSGCTPTGWRATRRPTSGVRPVATDLPTGFPRRCVMSDDPEDGSTDEPTDELTHTDASGEVRMVDVGDKPDTSRRAVARGEIRLTPSTIEAVEADEVGGKATCWRRRGWARCRPSNTRETIPMCHQIPITNVDTDFSVGDDRDRANGRGRETTGKTGCEMERWRARRPASTWSGTW